MNALRWLSAESVRLMRIVCNRLYHSRGMRNIMTFFMVKLNEKANEIRLISRMRNVAEFQLKLAFVVNGTP